MRDFPIRCAFMFRKLTTDSKFTVKTPEHMVSSWYPLLKVFSNTVAIVPLSEILISGKFGKTTELIKF